jgi:hypothetical protein
MSSAQFGSFQSVSISSTAPEGFHYEAGRCPSAGMACNCPGFCRPQLVKDDEANT